MSVFGDFALTLAAALAAALVVGLAARFMPWPRLPSWTIHLVWLAALGWAAVFLALSFAKHDAFNSHAYDLAIYDQVVWNTSQGRLFQNSIMHFLPHFLGDHFSLGLLALAPLYWLWPDPKTLLAVQSVAVALAAIPAAFFASWRLKSALPGIVIGIVYLLHPGNSYTALFDFHDIVFAPPLIGLALLFLFKGMPRAFVAALLPILLIKEEMGIVVATVGLWTLIFTRYRRAGAAVMAVGVIWLALVLLVLVPQFNPDGQYYYLRRYFDSGEPGGGTTASAAKVIGLFTGLATAEKAAYLGHLVVPLVLLPFGGAASLMALPTFLYQIMSTEFPFGFISKHYSVLLLPFLAFGTVQAIASISTRWPRLLLPLLAALLTAGGMSYYLQSPGPLGRGFVPRRYAPNPRASELEAAMRLIPADGRVMAQTDLVPHLAHRQTIYMFPDAPKFADADYVLLDLAGNKYPLSNPEDEYDIALQQYILNPDFDTAYDKDNVLLLVRRSTSRQPAKPLDIDFAHRIALDGYTFGLTSLAPGDDLEITLWWRALTDVQEEYQLFLHVVDGSGKTVAQRDLAPTESWFPTSRWEEGRRFMVTYVVPLPDDLPAGNYALSLGIYEVNSQRRAGIVGAGDNQVDLPDVIAVR